MSKVSRHLQLQCLKKVNKRHESWLTCRGRIGLPVFQICRLLRALMIVKKLWKRWRTPNLDKPNHDSMSKKSKKGNEMDYLIANLNAFSVEDILEKPNNFE
ncbi:hypothetical protein ACFE04_022123 [Oxalis oulophora]